MSKIKVYGITTLNVNGCKIHTLNIRINPSSIILNKIIEDPIWKDKHTLGMSKGKTVVTFTYTTTDENEFSVHAKRLHNILFAHKVDKLIRESCFVEKKENILWETLAEIKDVNGCL